MSEGGYRVVNRYRPRLRESVEHLHFHVLGERVMGWPPGLSPTPTQGIGASLAELPSFGLKDTRDTVNLTEEDSVTPRPRCTFTAEQKAKAVRLTREAGNINQVARDLDLCRLSMVLWIRQAEIDAGQG